MKYFLGEFDHTMDSKGRVSLPARFRDIISDAFYITKGLDNGLFIFPEWAWQNIIEKLMEIPLQDYQRSRMRQAFLSGVVEANLDKQGRVMINPKLREYAKLKKDVVITGAGDRIDIYAKEVAEQRNSAFADADQSITSETFRLLGV